MLMSDCRICHRAKILRAMCCNSTLLYPLFFFASAALNAFPGLFEKDDLMVFLRRNPLAVRYLHNNQPALF